MKYRVQVYDLDATFGPNNLLVEFDKTKNLGYADYANDVPEAFFTIDQDDSRLTLLRGETKTAFVKIYRNTDLVWAGRLGEHHATYRDVVFYCYGALAGLFLLVSDWNMAWTNEQVDTIVTDLWTLAKTTRTDSPVGWVTTGTIQAPVTTSGGATPFVLPTYKVYYKKILSCLRELSAISIGNTTNTVLFEITPAGVFNFWKNRGVDSGLTWRMGDRYVMDFDDKQAPLLRRNDLLTVGINPNSITMRNQEKDDVDAAAYGRQQEPLFFSWVRDSDELERVGELRLARAVRDQLETTVSFFPDSVIPPGATGAGFKITDLVGVVLDRGITNVDSDLMVNGYQVIYFNGQERVRALVQGRPGT